MEAPKIHGLDSYAVDVEDEGSWDFLDLTGGLDLGELVSICVDYDQLRELYLPLPSLFPRPLSIMFVGLSVVSRRDLIFLWLTLRQSA